MNASEIRQLMQQLVEEGSEVSGSLAEIIDQLTSIADRAATISAELTAELGGYQGPYLNAVTSIQDAMDAIQSGRNLLNLAAGTV